MRYGKINEAIWTDDRFRTLTDRSKLLYIYLLSCPNCTCIGIFQIGYGTMEDEFGRDREEIKESIDELCSAGLIGYEDKWLWFNKFLRWNQPINPNHAKQCAAFVNECITRNAPKEAIWNLLSTASAVLKPLKYQTKDGRTRTYYDEFKAVLEVQALEEFLGGEEELQRCLSGKQMNVKQTLPKGSKNTFRRPQDSEENDAEQTLQEGSGNVTETLGTNKNKYKYKYNTSNKTRPVQTGSCLSVRNSNEQISVTCSDGQLHEIPVTTILSAIGKYSGLDVTEAARQIADETARDKIIRPDPSNIDNFFMNAIRLKAIQGVNT